VAKASKPAKAAKPAKAKAAPKRDLARGSGLGARGSAKPAKPASKGKRK
jgi:hypothetical protein